MNMLNTTATGQSMGLALVRWGLGLRLLVSGAAKVTDLGGFVNGYILPAFAKTILPDWMLIPYAYALPIVELLLGVLLIIGLFRALTLFISGLTFLSLAFGQMLLKQHAAVLDILLYLGMTAALLCLGDYDRWVLPGAKRPAAKKSA